MSTAQAVGNATNGKTLYNTPYSGLSCANAACHGANPSSNIQKILLGANSGATIMNAITVKAASTGMGFLSAYITAAQADDIGAYIANPSLTPPVTTVATVSPTALSFGNQAIGVKSASQVVTLTNSGTNPMSISGITISTTLGYSGSTTCLATLAVGASCTVTAAFTPASAGLKSGSITITSNAVSSPTIVNLSGTGVTAQSIGVISFAPATLAVGGTTTASATATSALAVSFSSTTTGVCTVSGNTVTSVAAGTCTIAANQAGNASYGAATQVTQSIAVKTNQSIGTISFAPTTLAVGGATTASATATSGLAVSFSSMTPGVCTVSGGTITGVAAGTCTITASQTGNTSYNAATPVSQSITVDKASQSIGAVSFAPATLVMGGTTTASATATSGLVVGFSSTTPVVCTVNGNIVTGIATGTCTIAADQAGNANYNPAAQVLQSINVGKGSQTIGSISFTPTSLAVGGATTVTATATSGLAVNFTSVTPDVCTINGSTITGASLGTCTIAVDQAGDTNYNPATQVTQSITVKGIQSIGVISFAPTTLAVGGTTTASASATSGLAVSFTTATPTVCTVNGSTITGVTAGACTITASQPGDTGYIAATPVSQSLTVDKASQSIGAVSFAPATLVMGGATTASATATSGLAVGFSSTTPTVCTVNGNTVTGIAVGTCTIAADQVGSTNYNPATQVTQSIPVGKANQTISMISFSTTALTVGGSITASATATSGLAVSFSSVTPDVCTVSGITITGVTAGVCTIAADQSGDANYNAASQVTQSVAPPQTNLAAGWSLIGNSANTPLDVTTLGDATSVITVWKWLPATGKWAFYSPSLAAAGTLVTYATGKGYDVLATINGGEGFWINAKTAFAAQLPAGTPVLTADFQMNAPKQLPAGWSLVAVGDKPTPRMFNNGISATQPGSGVILPNLTTLWAWDNTTSSWYFYAPGLDANGGLATYISSKGYRDFGVNTLDPTMGFWVNHP